MSRQKAGLKKEHEIAKEVCNITDGKVIPLRAGWSGNSAPPLPDLLVPYEGSLRAIEIKTSKQKRMSVSQEDLSDIIHWSMKVSEIPVYPYLSVKFTHYEMQTMRLKKPWDIDESLKIMAEECNFDSNYTKSGNITFGHPTHYECDITSAQQSPGDGAALLRDLRSDGYASVDPNERDSVGIYEMLEKIN